MPESDGAYVQKDGRLPAILAAGSAPGESGIAVRNVRFRGGAHYSGTAKHHQIWFASPAQFNCHIAGRSLSHGMPPGALAIGPAGIDCVADVEGSFESVVVTLEPAQFALAAAEDEAYDAQLMERVLIQDEALALLAHSLTAESARGYPNGPLHWQEIASRFIDGLLLRHTSNPPPEARGRLSKDVLARLRDYIAANLDAPIAVATLADMAGRSPFHFTRLFTQSVGVTPHRYIVHLRLKRAVELIRDGRCGLAEIAARTGFADQSHLSRWVKRVHGVSLRQLAV